VALRLLGHWPSVTLGIPPISTTVPHESLPVQLEARALSRPRRNRVAPAVPILRCRERTDRRSKRRVSAINPKRAGKFTSGPSSGHPVRRAVVLARGCARSRRPMSARRLRSWATSHWRLRSEPVASRDWRGQKCHWRRRQTAGAERGPV